MRCIFRLHRKWWRAVVVLFLLGGVVGEVRFIFGALSERININVYKYYTYKNAAAVDCWLICASWLPRVQQFLLPEATQTNVVFRRCGKCWWPTAFACEKDLKTGGCEYLSEDFCFHRFLCKKRRKQISSWCKQNLNRADYGQILHCPFNRSYTYLWPVSWSTGCTSFRANLRFFTLILNLFVVKKFRNKSWCCHATRRENLVLFS